MSSNLKALHTYFYSLQVSHVGKPRAASAPGDDGFFSLLLELILFGVAT
jgi:hypothetical protein